MRFEVQIRAFEDGGHAFDQSVRFELGDTAVPIDTSQRLTDQFARGYHGIKDPTPGDINNVMCNELFHLLRQQAQPDEQRTLFISGCLLRLCAQPEDGEQFRGLGRHPQDDERLLLTIRRENLPGGRARHASVFVPLEPALRPLGTA
ncbi:MAG: hypothetical protein L6R19_14835 [Alphaproteobacteria bacterium]|nr:hypothetical protein [Alphaproteobacteria bacterium]